jgi:hypothetical protein
MFKLVSQATHSAWRYREITLASQILATLLWGRHTNHDGLSGKTAQPKWRRAAGRALVWA